MEEINKLLNITVADAIRTIDSFGKQMKKTLDKIVRVFGFNKIRVNSIVAILLNSPKLLSRPPTFGVSIFTVKPLMMASLVVIGGFIFDLWL